MSDGASPRLRRKCGPCRPGGRHWPRGEHAPAVAPLLWLDGRCRLRRQKYEGSPPAGACPGPVPAAAIPVPPPEAAASAAEGPLITPAAAHRAELFRLPGPVQPTEARTVKNCERSREQDDSADP